MGIDSAAFHRESRTFVDLGKGPWRNLDYNAPLLSLAADAIDEWGGLEGVETPRNHVVYTVWVCARIQTFLRTGKWESTPTEGPLEGVVLADYNDEYLELKYSRTNEPYREIGSRFVQKDAPTIDYEGEVLRYLSREEIDLILATAND